MLMPPEGQDWVPQAVADMANTLRLGKEIAARLLTDQRMRTVWKELRDAKKVPQDVLGHLPGWQRLEDAHDVSLQDQACAAIFAFAAVEFSSSSRRVVGTRRQFNKLAEPWLDAARLCDWAIETEPRVRIDEQLRTALALAGAFFKSAGRLREQKGSPYVVGRSSRRRGDDEVRGKTRRLAVEVHKIFGAFHYGTTATIAAVALNLKARDVTAQDVKNWCKHLLLPD